jgi:hypothetical protein
MLNVGGRLLPIGTVSGLGVFRLAYCSTTLTTFLAQVIFTPSP